MTTDNINYRNLLNVKAVSRRQTPPQWFRVPSDTYFNPGALETLRTLHSEQALIVTDADTEARGRRRGAPSSRRAGARVRRCRAGAARGARSRRGRSGPQRAARPHHRRRGRLRDRRRQGDPPVPRVPGALAGRADVAVPRRAQACRTVPGDRPFAPACGRPHDRRHRFGGLPGRRAHGRRAQADARRLLARARHGCRRPAPDADHAAGPDGRYRRRRAHARARGRRLDFRLALHGRLLHAGVAPDPRRAAARLRRRLGPRGADVDEQRGHARRPGVLERVRRRLPLLAHAVGARFGIAHGRANGIFLPHVLRYNAAIPRKFMPAPGYTTYVAPEKYAQMAWVHGLGGRSAEDRRARLFTRVEALLDEVGLPRSLAEAGVGQAEFDAALPELAEAAFMDPSMRTNPRMPLVAELVDLLRAGWAGR